MLNTAKTLLQSRLRLPVGAAAVVTAAALVTYRLGWLPGPWLAAILTFLGGLGLFAGIYWGVPRLQERRFLRQERAQGVVGSEAGPEQFRAKFMRALEVLQGLPQLKGTSEPFYALPLYLLLGPPAAGKTVMLRGSGLFTPLLKPTDGDGPTTNFEWWVSKTAMVLDASGRYADQPNVEQDRAEWYRLLRLLRQHRDREPVTAVLVVVGADWLATQSDEQLHAEASTLRQRLEEAVHELGIDFPMYLLVSKCDTVEGFGEFFAKLPARVCDEVLGYVDDQAAAPNETKARGVAAVQRLQAGLEAIYQRLHFFRVPLLDSNVPDALRPAIFCFPEEFRALTRALTVFAEPLLKEDVQYHTPLFRGIFFASVRQGTQRLSLMRRALNVIDGASPGSEGSRRYFVTDLFERILPRDRGLVVVTPEARRRRGVLRAAILILVSAGALTGGAVLARAYFVDRRLADSADASACPHNVPPARTARLAAVDRCRVAVQQLAEQNAGRSGWSTRFFDRSIRLEDDLRQRYVQQFHHDVLVPLNQALDLAFGDARDPLPLMLMVARRIQLDRRCLSAAGCSARSLAELEAEYPIMLVPTADRRAPPDEVARLGSAYAAYALWQSDPKADLQRDLADDQKRLRQWLSTKQFSLDHLVTLVDSKSPPLTYDDYWTLPGPISSTAPQISASCTRDVWQEVVAPFLQQLQDAVPDVAPKLREFQAEYRRTCLAQWKRFLSSFTDGAARWRGPDRQRTLALELLTPESPCLRVIDDAVANLGPWLQGPGDPAGPPPWAEQLRQWVGSDSQQAYLEAVKKVRQPLDKGPFAEACFKLTQSAFAEGTPAEGVTNPLLHAWWVASRATQGTAGEAGVLEPLLEQPLRFVWRVMLDEAATEIQRAWTENVIAPLRGLPAAEQLVQLYGPGGRMGMFGEQFLRPFLGGDVTTSETLLGEAMPFSPEFAQVLSHQQELKEVLEGGGGPQPVRIRAAGRSRIESRATIRGEQTLFSITCDGRAYRITNRPEDPSESVTTVPWSSQGCGDVTITIYFFPGLGFLTSEDPQGAKRMQLSTTYSGRSGFLQFLKDFESGVHRFPLDRLSGDPDALRSGVLAVSVSYQIDVPPGLTKVMAALQAEPIPEEVVAPPS